MGTLPAGSKQSTGETQQTRSVQSTDAHMSRAQQRQGPGSPPGFATHARGDFKKVTFMLLGLIFFLCTSKLKVEQDAPWGLF